MDIKVPVVTQVADWGAEEPYVARIEIGLSDMIRGLRYIQDDSDDLLWVYQQIGDELDNAFISLRRIRAGGMLLYEARKEYANLYGHLWAAYKDRQQAFMMKFGYDIGFIFQKEATFLKSLTVHCAEYNLPNEFAEALIHDRNNWQVKIADIRNEYNEHRKLPNDTDKKYFRPVMAEIMFNNVWQAIEDIIACHIKAEFARDSKNLTIYEIPLADRNPDMPTRFQIGLTPEGMKGLPTS